MHVFSLHGFLSGLCAETPRLWVIDGAKALRREIMEIYGQNAPVQRCQEHKRRNVLDNLPKELHASAGRALRGARDSNDPVLAKCQLKWLARSLERVHPRATASLLEGPDETLGVCGPWHR